HVFSPRRLLGRAWGSVAVDRGYGSAHQKLRRHWAVKVARGEVCCARCDWWIAPDGEPCPRCGKVECGWDLGHVDGSNKREYSGPEHRCCNRATRAHAAKRRTRVVRRARWW